MKSQAIEAINDMGDPTRFAAHLHQYDHAKRYPIMIEESDGRMYSFAVPHARMLANQLLELAAAIEAREEQ